MMEIRVKASKRKAEEIAKCIASKINAKIYKTIEDRDKMKIYVVADNKPSVIVWYARTIGVTVKVMSKAYWIYRVIYGCL